MTRLWTHTRSAVDVRANFERFVRENGHYVLYRRYDTRTPSTHYNPVTQEGVGGGRYAHVDEAVLCRHDPKADGVEIDRTKCYVMAAVIPKRGDMVIELKTDVRGPAEAYHAEHDQAYRVVDLDKKRAEHGRIAFYTLYLEPHFGPY